MPNTHWRHTAYALLSYSPSLILMQHRDSWVMVSGPPSIFSPFFQPHRLTNLFHHEAATLFPPATLCPTRLSFVVLLSTGEGQE